MTPPQSSGKAGKACSPCSHPFAATGLLRWGTFQFRSTKGTHPAFSPAPVSGTATVFLNQVNCFFWSRLSGKLCAERSAKQERGRVTLDVSKNTPHLKWLKLAGRQVGLGSSDVLLAQEKVALGPRVALPGLLLAMPKGPRTWRSFSSEIQCEGHRALPPQCPPQPLPCAWCWFRIPVKLAWGTLGSEGCTMFP